MCLQLCAVALVLLMVELLLFRELASGEELIVSGFTVELQLWNCNPRFDFVKFIACLLSTLCFQLFSLTFLGNKQHHTRDCYCSLNTQGKSYSSGMYLHTAQTVLLGDICSSWQLGIECATSHLWSAI